jgi:hypothetical protein
MAETLTIDPTPPAEIVGESEGVQLTAEEQDSLNVGEKIQQEEGKLLAGKYKNAEELEKAYGELQRKLGEKDNKDSETVDETEVSETDEVPEEKKEATDFTQGAQTIMSASDEYYQNDGKLSEETLNKFSSMSSKELVQAYMEVQKSGVMDQQQVDDADLSDQAINEVKNYAGGEDSYANLVNWAGQNLDQQSIEAFDSIVGTGSVEAIKIAVSGLKAQYENANGYEGKMYSGKPPQETKDAFRSQAELVAAMSDPRYDNDPAYRQDIIQKLERSNNLEF